MLVCKLITGNTLELDTDVHWKAKSKWNGLASLKFDMTFPLWKIRGILGTSFFMRNQSRINQYELGRDGGLFSFLLYVFIEERKEHWDSLHQKRNSGSTCLYKMSFQYRILWRDLGLKWNWNQCWRDLYFTMYITKCRWKSINYKLSAVSNILRPPVLRSSIKVSCNDGN